MAWHTPTCQGLEILWADGAPSCKRCGSRAPASDHGGPLEDLPPPPPPPPTKRSQLRCTWPKSVNFVDLPAEQEGAILGEIDSWEIGHYKLEESDARSETEDALQQAAKVDTAQNIPKIGELERLDQSRNLQTLYPKIEGSGSIRLLRIFGAAFFGDPLHSGLVVVNLNDPRCPIFEALSYTWADDNGDKSRCKRIYIGPEYHTLPVTRNCDLALRRLRTQLERLVWVDAVCINQEDDLERNSQVALMQQIYSTASRVVVYLGEETNGAGVAMDILAAEEEKDIESIGPEVEGPLLALLTRPYFFRTWVIQEVVMAYKATIICGDRTIAWAALEHALQSKWFKRRSDVPVWMAQTWKSGLHSDLVASSLMQLLEHTISCLAGDPRDKIFGILGLMGGEAADEGIVPEYSLSVQQVYTGIAAYLLRKSSAKISERIRYVMMNPKEIPNLPSWVPDWTNIHSASKTSSEEPETVVIHIKSGAESMSVWYNESLDVSLKGKELDIADKGFHDEEAQMLEHGEEIWGDHFHDCARGAVKRWYGEGRISFSSRSGSLAVLSSLLFWVDQEGRLHSGPRRELTNRAPRGDILYQGGDAPRLDKEKEIRFIPALGGVFLAKRHQMGNTVSLLGKCSIMTFAASESLNIAIYCLERISSYRLNDFKPADKKWYTLQLRTMCAEIYRMLSWQNTMSFLARKREDLAKSGNVRHTSSSASRETKPTKEADNNLRELQQMWEDVVAEIRLDEQHVKEGPDLNEMRPTSRSIEVIIRKFHPRVLENAWEIECLRGEDETLASCSEHISSLRKHLIPSLTFGHLVDYVYHFDDFIYHRLFWSSEQPGDRYGWKWKFWFLTKKVWPVLRRPFIDESDLSSFELTRIRLWEQIATLHLIIDLQASSAATGIQINTWAARKHVEETIIV